MSSDTSRSSEPRPQGAGSLRKTAVVIYATLVLLTATIPESVVGWVREFKSTEVQDVLLPAAQALERLGQATGISAPYTSARAAFLALTSGQTNN
jgi:hypothetical protein